MVVVWLNEKENDEVHDREIEANFCWVLMCNSEQKLRYWVLFYFNFFQFYFEIINLP